MIAPCWARSLSISASAAGVATTRARSSCIEVPALKEAELLRAIAHQHVFGLLIMVEHHLVVLAPDAGLLIAAEGRVGGIGVIAIGPDAARLYRAAEAIAAVHVAAPHASAKAIERVVGDGEGVVVVLEGRHGD